MDTRPTRLYPLSAVRYFRFSDAIQCTFDPTGGRTSQRGGEEADMQVPATEIGRPIAQLNEFILPNSLKESFDMYREESVKSAALRFNDAQLSFLNE